MIAIARHEIPHVFGAETLAEAEKAAKLPLTPEGREDLRELPIVAIDPIDARDHDVAVWAVPDEEHGNKGGFRAIAQIADVSYYVRPAGDLARHARPPGKRVYFHGQVVPLHPETLHAG